MRLKRGAGIFPMVLIYALFFYVWLGWKPVQCSFLFLSGIIKSFEFTNFIGYFIIVSGIFLMALSCGLLSIRIKGNRILNLK